MQEDLCKGEEIERRSQEEVEYEEIERVARNSLIEQM